MRWQTFAIFAFVFLILELGLVDLLGLGPQRAIVPNWLLILMVYIALFAPGRTACWAAIILGLLADIVHDVPFANPDLETAALGPHALGFLVGAYLTLQIRAMLFRNSPFTVAIVVFVAGIFASLTTIILLGLRGVVAFSDPIADFSSSGRLVTDFLRLLYTAAAAIPIGWLLGRFRRTFGFQVQAKGHR